jgi:signal transduction histidine kinase
MPIALPAVFGVVWASQLVLGGKVSWASALGTEVPFWFSWGIVAMLIFRLCRLLHGRVHDRRRYAIGLTVGAVGAVVAFPAVFESITIGGQWLGRALSLATKQPDAFWPSVRAATINLLGFSVILYTATVCAWHAITYYRDLKERKFQAAELESLLHQAQLEALRNQLHPHFLFNTLHSIAELVHENPALAEQLILRLSELLRSALKAPVLQEVPLADELEFTRSYLEIEQMRLGDRLTVAWEVAEETLAARVPSVLLQPLIENAIQHGIAALNRPGRLSIRARRDDGHLLLQVQDTGPGLKTGVATSGSGIGLANTESRLKRLYGARQRFELVNRDGLLVSIRIPFVVSATAPAVPVVS